MTRKITPTGSIPFVNPSSSINVAAQITDVLKGLQAQLSQLISEYNSEVQPILNSLPQGRSDSRWRLTDTIKPLRNGLDGSNLFVDNNSTSTTDGGRYYTTDLSRPKTVKESLTAIYSYIADSVDSVRSEVSSYSSGTGISPSAVLRIGANIFDATQTSSASSLDGLTQSNQANILQLAKDLYDDNLDSLDGDGEPNLSYSLYDHLVALLGIHGGTFDTDLSLTHDGVGASIGASYRSWTGTTNASTTSTSELVVGGFLFDPSQFGAAIGGLNLYFEGLLNYIAAGAAGEGYLRLYDMGSPGAIGAGTLVSELTYSHSAGGIMGRERATLSVVTSGPSTDEILNEIRVYELRIITDGMGDPTDLIMAIWGGINVEPTV